MPLHEELMKKLNLTLTGKHSVFKWRGTWSIDIQKVRRPSHTPRQVCDNPTIRMLKPAH